MIISMLERKILKKYYEDKRKNDRLVRRKFVGGYRYAKG